MRFPGGRCPRNKDTKNSLTLQGSIKILNKWPQISDLKCISESSDRRFHQYSCGYESGDSSREVDTQWVKARNSPFSSPSMPLSRSTNATDPCIRCRSDVRYGASSESKMEIPVERVWRARPSCQMALSSSQPSQPTVGALWAFRSYIVGRARSSHWKFRLEPCGPRCDMKMVTTARSSPIVAET